MPVEMPEYLIGIGGSGSRIVEGIMSRDWVIQNLVEQEAENDAEMRARTIDSATGAIERADRTDAEENIKEKIITARKNHDLNIKEDMNLVDYAGVNFRHYNYIENTKKSETRTQVLTRPQDVNPNLLDNTRRLENSWWLADHEELLTGGFSNGVKRRRALSKALYHVSSVHAENEPYHPQELNVENGDVVVMVVALGGGTGSGSFIDLAVDMADDAQIHLFAVMPDAGNAGGNSEGTDELTSAHAALSELEYIELAGESPFEDITLIPYLARNDIEPVDVEDAVAHTVLSHQGLVNAGNGDNHLIPGRENAISDIASFNVAVPRIVRYNVGMREQARKDVESYLEDRRSQLEVESGLYDAVENYLGQNFDDSFDRYVNPDGQTARTVSFNFDNENQQKQLLAMAKRLEEQLQGTLLQDQNLRVAGLGDAVDEIQGAIRTVYASQFDSVDSDGDEEGPVYEQAEERDRSDPQYAEEIVRQIPNQVPDIVDVGQFDEGNKKEFVQIVLQELKNIEDRYELLRAVFATKPERLDDLEERQVNKIKNALTNVALRSDVRKLVSEFPNNDIRVLRDNLWQELAETELAYAQLELFEEEITQKLRDTFQQWEEDVAEELDVVVEYHRRRQTIAEELEKLNKACTDKAKDLSNEDVQAKHLKQSLESADGKINIRELNNQLEAVGLDKEIERETLTTDITNLINAKEAYEKYHSRDGFFGLFSSSDEHEQTFDSLKRSVNEMGGDARFNITTSIENQFNVDYKYDYTDILGDVDDRYETAVENVRLALENLLTNKNNVLVSHSVRELVEQDTIVDRVTTHGSIQAPELYFEERDYGGDKHLETDGYFEFKSPESGDQVWSSVHEMEERLKNMDPGSIEGLLDLKQSLSLEEEFTARRNRPIEREVVDNPNGVVESLVNLYLEPIWTEQDSLNEELERLGSSYDAEGTEGRYQAVARLIRLADKKQESPVDDGLELAETDSHLSYGFDFHHNFKREYHKITRSEGQSVEQSDPDRNNALLRTFDAAERDLVGSPDSIEDSTIWEENEDQIKPEFKQSIKDIRDGRYGRLPVDLNELKPPEGSDAEYNFNRLRLINVFSSRSFETNEAGNTTGPDQVKEVSKKGTLEPLLNDQDGYMGMTYGHGDDWTLSIVTFVSGFTLDMLEPLTEGDGGYADVYEGHQNKLTYPRRNHSLGLEGNWDRWETLKEWARNNDNPDWFPNGGAYLWRAETESPGEICAKIWRVENSDMKKKDDAKADILDHYEYQLFRSTVHPG